MTLFQNKYRIESPRLRDWDYRTRGWYLVTICTHNRRHIFGSVVDNEIQLSIIGRIADRELRALSTHHENVHVDEHIVMPNHVRAIIMIDAEHYLSPRSEATLAGQLSVHRYRPKRVPCPR